MSIPLFSHGAQETDDILVANLHEGSQSDFVLRHLHALNECVHTNNVTASLPIVQVSACILNSLPFILLHKTNIARDGHEVIL